jgi:hypothetical protein
MARLGKYYWEALILVIGLAASLLFGVLSYVIAPTEDGEIAGYTGLWIGIISGMLVSILLANVKASSELSDHSQTLALSKERLDDLFREGHLRAKRGHHLWPMLNNVVKYSGQACFDDYSSKFEPHEHGFDVRGEEWSLSSYGRVWEQLVEEQKTRNEQGRSKIIVRATHSNDIGIWGDQAEHLLSLQKDFLSYGGIVVRLLLYRTEEPSEEYQSIKEKMESKGIEARLCKQLQWDAAGFDFLWACDNEKAGELHCVVKWYPGTGGWRLMGCEITDLVDDEVRSSWRLFAHRSEEIEGPFKCIPEDRTTV